MLECIHCGRENRMPHHTDYENLITTRCWFCRNLTPTGREASVRPVWEECVGRDYPEITAARAIGLSNAIYKTAETGSDVIKMKKTRKAIVKNLSRRGHTTSNGIVDYVLIKGRTHRGYTDSTTVGAVVVVDNGTANPRYSIFVVFRGSAGDIMAANDPTVNVDWRANFDNAMEFTDYAGMAIRIHGGFKNSLGSYRDRMLKAMNLALRIYPNSHVVVTGHSQGAGHAQLFCHWLAYKQPEPRVLCIPFSPPRVGNFPFAMDFTRKISDQTITLPFDGPKKGCYLMVKGQDPVVFDMKHAFRGESEEAYRKAADSGNLLKQAKYARKSEKHRSIATDAFFHPKYLTQLSSMVPKVGLIKGIDHHPGLFRDKVLGGL